MSDRPIWNHRAGERKTNLVYLTADSEHELEDFKDDEVYIITASWTGTVQELDSEQGQRAGHQARAAANQGSPQDVRHARAHRQPDARLVTRLELRDWDQAMDRCAHAKERGKRARRTGRKGEGPVAS